MNEHLVFSFETRIKITLIKSRHSNLKRNISVILVYNGHVFEKKQIMKIYKNRFEVNRNQSRFETITITITPTEIFFVFSKVF